jgi:hypothetical protein
LTAVVFWSALAASLVLAVAGVAVWVRGASRSGWQLVVLAALLCGVVPLALRSTLMVLTAPVALFLLVTAAVIGFSSRTPNTHTPADRPGRRRAGR